MFQGELLVIADNAWIVGVFGSLLVASAAGALALTILSRRRGRRVGLGGTPWDRGVAWYLPWALGALVVGVGTLVLTAYLVGMLGGILSEDLLALQYVLGGVLVAFGLFPLVAGGLWIVRLAYWIRTRRSTAPRSHGPRHRAPRPFRGLVGFSASFLFVGVALGLSLATMNPQFAPGLETRQPVFTAGQLYGAYPTGFGDEPSLAGYRIPSLVALPGDVLLAFAEARADPWSDWGNIDLVMRRSFDAGDTWSAMEVVAAAGAHTAGNPCPVYDETTGVLHVMYNVDNEQVWVVTTADGGETWSAPRDLTGALGIRPIPGTFHVTHGCGPGTGIQLQSGRLVVPAYYWNASGCHVIYSDDHGTTWALGGMVGAGAEPQVVEGVNGSLYINMRNDGAGCNCREVAWSSDGGVTWTAPRPDPALPDVPCQASVARLTHPAHYRRGRVLYAGPNYHVRGHYVVRVSYDEGETWPVERELYPGPAAYGQLVVLSNKSVGLLLECGRYDYREGIQFVRFAPGWIARDSDPLVPG